MYESFDPIGFLQRFGDASTERFREELCKLQDREMMQVVDRMAADDCAEWRGKRRANSDDRLESD